jgi:tRNA 2-thiouridine synthesizing protein A
MTWVRLKLRLEALSAGDTLEVLLKGDEPLRNLPRNARDDGHGVRSLEVLPDGTARMVLDVAQGKVG